MIEPAVLCGGRYELGPVIGRGGMAEVRGARDTRLDRPVAVKLLRPEVAHQPGARSRFESEARLAARLSHPHVVAVHDSGEADGVPFIVMERLPGPTLHDRLREGALPVAEVRAMAGQVLSALQAAHEAGILHRDIKPGNVMVAAGGGWKVGDFGIAKALEMDRQDLTATGLLIGTPAYLAPERFFGSPATVASDLYAVAVLLYEALAGRKPFDADRADAWASVAAGATPAPLESLRSGVDRDLAAAIERGMAKNPADRFWSAAEMAAVIGKTVAADPGAAPPTRVLGDPGRPPADETSPWGRPPAATAPPAAGSRSGPPSTDVLPLGVDHQRRGPTGWIRDGGLTPRLGTAVAAAGAVIVAVVVILAVALSGGGHRGAGAPSSSAPPSSSATTSAPSTPPSSTATTGGSGGTGSSATLPGPLDRALKNLERQVGRKR